VVGGKIKLAITVTVPAGIVPVKTAGSVIGTPPAGIVIGVGAEIINDTAGSCGGHILHIVWHVSGQMLHIDWYGLQ
jgi:hypothetical protein